MKTYIVRKLDEDITAKKVVVDINDYETIAVEYTVHFINFYEENVGTIFVEVKRPSDTDWKVFEVQKRDDGNYYSIQTTREQAWRDIHSHMN